MVDEGVWQAQVEELVALSSILEQDFRLISHQCDAAEEEDDDDAVTAEELLGAPPPEPFEPLAFDVRVHVDLAATGPLDVVIQQPGGASSSSTSTSEPSASDELTPTGIQVLHLPPLRLRVTLPADYPADSPPVVELSATWLQPHQVQQLHQALQRQWLEPGVAGSPVCFQFVEWLRASTLHELGITQTGRLVLHTPPAAHHGASSAAAFGSPPPPPLQPASAAPAGLNPQAREWVPPAAAPASAPEPAGAPPPAVQPAGQNGAGSSHGSGDPREGGAFDAEGGAAPQLPPELLAMSLALFSSSRERELFRTQACTCPVCFEDVLGAKCVRLDCGHFACHGCFTQYARTQLTEGAVDSIRCVNPSCRAPVPPGVLREVLSADEFRRWEDLLLQKTLDGMEDMHYCPRCQAITIADEEHCARCPKCLFVFCGLCLEGWHPGIKCLMPHEVLQRKRERLERAGNMSVEQRQQLLQDLLNQHKSYMTIKSTSMQCPTCGMAIQKSEGCNKMRCTNCSGFFCFVCGRAITDYNHFGENRCVLFDNDEIARWNNAMNDERHLEVAAAHYLVQQARRGQNLHLVRYKACPTCGQLNIKTANNNLIRCHGCGSHYCYLCRAPLHQKPGQHFGPSRCRQHSDD